MRETWEERIKCPDNSIIKVYKNATGQVCFNRGGVTQVCSIPLDKTTATNFVAYSEYNLHTIKLLIEKIDEGDYDILRLCCVLGDK